MRGFSKAIIAGNLTRDPELRSTTTGNSVCRFGVAVNRSFRVNGELREETSFIDCTAWGKTGETISQYLHKGSAILLSGRLSQSTWEDKETGQKRSRVEIVVDDFNFISGGDEPGTPSYRDTAGSAGTDSAAKSDAAAPAASGANDMMVPDEIPDEIDLSTMPF